MRNPIVLLLSAAAVFAADGKMEPKKTTAAIVDGMEIAEEDFAIQPQVTQLRKQEYELRLRLLDNAISRKLLEKAASGRNLSPEEFLKQEVDGQIPEPTEGEIEGFYWGQKDKFAGPLEKVREQVKEALKRAKIQDGRQTLLQKLRQQAAVRILIEPPRISVRAGNAPRKGSPSAPVTIVEFSDYECPYCKRMQPVLQQISAKYADKVSFVFKDYPLTSIHPTAQAAAEAAHCAGDQGKYWEYHDALFSEPALNSQVLLETAAKLALDQEAFKACTASKKYKSVVESSIAEGQRVGVNGTPAFFVNGISLSGAVPGAALENVIDAELERSRGNSPR